MCIAMTIMLQELKDRTLPLTVEVSEVSRSVVVVVVIVVEGRTAPYRLTANHSVVKFSCYSLYKLNPSIKKQSE